MNRPSIIARPLNNNITRLFKSAQHIVWKDILHTKREGKL
jgi:hypothetical protein